MFFDNNYIIEHKSNKIKLPINQKEMDKILKSFKKEMRDALKTLFAEGKTVITAKNVKNMINNNVVTLEIGKELEQIMYNWKENILKNLYGDIINKTGKQTADILSTKINDIFKFSIVSPEILNFIEDETGRQIVEMSKSQIQSIKTALYTSLQENLAETKVREMIQNSISLTARETQATINAYNKVYAEMLEKNIASGMKQKQAIKLAKHSANKARLRKQIRLENARIERIHLTETARLKHFADMESLKQAQLKGKIKQAVKTWRKTGYSDNWNSSDVNDGVSILVKSDFQAGSPTTASSLQYPSEINERCILEYSIRK